MPVLSVQTNRLRYTTYEAVQKLVQSARVLHEKDALLTIYNIARQKKQATGFDFPTFDQCYTAYRNYKRSTEFRAYQKSASKNTHLHTFTHDENPDDDFLP
jgi:hypothetical protein